MGVNPLVSRSIVSGSDINNPPFNEAEKDNEIATWESVLSGIGSGLIKAVGNTVSLGAELIDLGADTNTAAQVEAYFEKINPFDEAAEATTAGKVTEVLSQLAIPGTAGFKLASAGVKGSKMASKAIKAKKNNKYLERNNGLKGLEELKKAEKFYNKKRFVAGIAGGTAAEIAVFDEDVGTFGTTFDFGLTRLSDDDSLEGRADAFQSLINRGKFGLESILLTGVIAGVGTTGKLLANHGKELYLSNNRIFQFIDNYIGSPLRAREKLSPEAFELKRQAIGQASKTRREATRAVNNLNASINSMFGKFRFSLSEAEKTQRDKIMKQVGRVVMSGESKLVPDFSRATLNNEGKRILKDVNSVKTPLDSPAFTEREFIKAVENGQYPNINLKRIVKGVRSGRLDFGGTLKNPLKGFDEKEVSKLKNLLRNTSGSKDFDRLYQSMYYTRLVADDVRNTFYNTDLVQKAAGKQYKQLVENKIGSFFETAFPLIETKSLARFLQYKPSRDTIKSVRDELIKVSRANPNLKRDYGGNGMTPEQADSILDQIIKANEIKLGRFTTKEGLEGVEKVLETFGRATKKQIEDAKGLKDVLGTRRVRPFEDAEALLVDFTAPTQLSKATLQKEFFGNKNLRKILGDEGDIRIRFFNTVETLTNYNTKLNLGRSVVNAIKNAEAAFGVGSATGVVRAANIKPGSAADRNLPIGFSNVDTARAILGEVPGVDFYRKVNMKDPKIFEAFGEQAASTKFNPFDKMVFHPKVAEALEGTTAWYMGDKPLLKFYRNLMLFPKATSQVAKTVLSPVTHMRNLISAGSFATANGVLPIIPVRPGDYAIFGRAVKDSFNALSRKNVLRDPKAAQNAYDELLELGVVNSNLRLGDVTGLLEDTGILQGRMLTDQAFSRVLNPFKKFYKKAEDAYVAEDDFWKIINFSSEKAKLMKAYGGKMPQFRNPFTGATETLNQRAARIVRNTVPNYDYVSGFIKNLRGLPFGNFVSFPAEIIRTGFNIVKQSIDEMVNPATGKISVDSPTFSIGLNRAINSFMTFAGVPYGLYEGMKALHDVSEDEMKALRKIVPSWSKNSVLLPMGRNDKGHLQYIDFSHANAYDTLIRPVQTVINSVTQGEQDAEKLTSSLLRGSVESAFETMQPFVSESIFFEAFNDILSRGGVSKTGKRVFDLDESVGDKIYKSMLHIAQTQIPGSGPQLLRLLRTQADEESDIIKQFDKYGQDYMFNNEIFGLFGYRVVESNPDRSVPYFVTAYRKTVDRTKGPLNSLIYRGGEVSPLDLTEAMIESNKRKYQLDKKFYQQILALRELGVDERILQKQINRIRGRTQRSSILTGKFVPIRLSSQDINVITTTAREKGFDNPLPTSLRSINKFISDVSNIPLNLESLEAETEVDDLLDDIKDRTKGQSSFIPDIFKQDLNTSMPTNIGTRTQNINPLSGLTRTQELLLSPEEKLIAARK